MSQEASYSAPVEGDADVFHRPFAIVRGHYSWASFVGDKVDMLGTVAAMAVAFVSIKKSGEPTAMGLDAGVVSVTMKGPAVGMGVECTGPTWCVLRDSSAQPGALVLQPLSGMLSRSSIRGFPWNFDSGSKQFPHLLPVAHFGTSEFSPFGRGLNSWNISCSRHHFI